MAPESPTTLAHIATASVAVAPWRQAALAELRSHLRFEAAVFHELSPRVPLSQAGVVGLELAVLAATTRQWDDLAVSLAPLMHTALAQHGVATDREAFGSRGPARTRWNRLVARPLGIRAALMAHLVVDERIISAVLLMRRRDPPFSTRERQAIAALLPLLTLGDAYHLARAQPSLPGMVTGVRCVDERLTPRQREVVEYVALGRTNAEIGAALGTSIHTVRNLLVRVCARLDAANRAEVVRLAVLHPQRS
jgi:DNA-binding CsgD family transcriptional regulator